eukprot:CAMPEP_0184494664 /NCGR_PEP_ID=MMETSP0113_2-20130426/29299_1 /TAXON_ID=91329 /ORGANISM="Norrisiella sphaerica, Strain BC52" /LENGTH=1080 /DNA_ID=CAMNT_0026880515 /DNA_START=14 /DNA_END=3256 /DNA_ORIENTATION=-
MTQLIARGCPKANDIFRSIVHYVYPTPNAQDTYEGMRRKFLHDWRHSMNSFVNEEDTEQAPEILHHHAKIHRQPYALLAKKLNAYKKSLQNRLDWVTGKRNLRTENYAVRFRVINRAVRRWRERTQWILFNWWKNTAKHAKARRRAFNKFVKERKGIEAVKLKKVMFYKWSQFILSKHLAKSQETLLQLKAEKVSLREEQAIVREDLARQYEEVKIQTLQQAKLEREELAVREQLKKRQHEVLKDSRETLEPAVLIVSMIRIVVLGLKVVESMVTRLDDYNLQDPLILLKAKPFNVHCPTLFKLQKPKTHAEIRAEIQAREKKMRERIEVQKSRSAALASARPQSTGKPKNQKTKSRKAPGSRPSSRARAQSPSETSLKPSSEAISSKPTSEAISLLERTDECKLPSEGESEVPSESDAKQSEGTQMQSTASHCEKVPHAITVEMIRRKVEEISANDNETELSSFRKYEQQVQALEAKRDSDLDKAKQTFERLSDQDLVLLWLNFHLSNSRRKSRQAEDFGLERTEEEEHRTENFGPDFQDCEVLGRLLNELVPNTAPMKIISSVDLFERASRIKDVLNDIGRTEDSQNTKVQTNSEHQFDFGDILEAHKLIKGACPERVFILLVKLFADYPTLDIENLDAYGEINTMIERWITLTQGFANPRQGALEKIKTVKQMNEEVIGLIFSSKMYIRDMQRRHEFWTNFLLPRVQKSALDNLHKYMNGEEIELENRSIADTVAADTRHYESFVANGASLRPVPAVCAYLNFSTENMMHYGTAERKNIMTRQLRESQRILTKHYKELRSIHRHYAQTDAESEGTCTMNLAEFWTFVKDIGITKPFRLTVKEKKVSLRPGTLLRVFCHVAQYDRNKDINPAVLRRMKLEETEFIQDYELDLKCFLQSILLIAIIVANSNIHELNVYLENFITQKIIPKSLLFENTSFRSNLQDLKVFRLFHRYRKYTLRVFYTYSVIHTATESAVESEKWKDTIDFKEFFQFCSDAEICSDTLSKQQLYYIFSSVQQEAFEANGDSAVELSYPEFLEALGAIAVYKRPIPYATVLSRIEKFLRLDLVPWIRRHLVMM